MEQINYYTCSVANGGDIRHVVTRRGCTAPELMLLRVIHGVSAAKNITLSGKVKTDSDSERERLVSIYGDKRVSEVFGGYAELPFDIGKAKIPKGMFAPGEEPMGTKTRFKSKKTVESEVVESMVEMSAEESGI